MRLLFATYLIALNANITHAQHGAITGIIYDSLTSSPVVYASIWLEPGVTGTITDTAGRFFVSDIPTGTYMLYASHVGHSNFRGEEITIYQDSTLVLNINLPECAFFTLGKSDFCPTCGKADQVIPIVYGKPTKRTIERASREEVKIAGCLIPECAPSKYCKRDKTEF